MLGDDYYEILGITRDATDREVRQAYRRMIKRYHPDLNPDLPDAERYLRAVVIAYETLGNKRRRANYDRIIFLLGPRRKTPSFTDQTTSRGRQTTMSRLEHRNREARRLFFAWLAIMVVLFSSYLVWVLYLSGGFFGRFSISPAIYAKTTQSQSPAYIAFRKEPVEDQWYLWYRNINYSLFMGEMGSARELAVAYTKTSRLAGLRGDFLTAYKYATAAVKIDPGYSDAVDLESQLQLQMNPPKR